MTSQVISRHAAGNVEELRQALDSFMVSAGAGEFGSVHPSTLYVYIDGYEAGLALEEETLSDGSTVYNLRLYPRAHATADGVLS